MVFPRPQMCIYVPGIKKVKRSKKKKSIVSGRKGSFYSTNTLYTGLCNIVGAAYGLGSEGVDQGQSCVMLRAKETIEPLERQISPNECLDVK